MKVLLDTHFLIWLVLDESRIRPDELAMMEKAEGPLLVSAVSLWELRIKWLTFDRDGVRKGALDPKRALDFIEGNDWLSLHDLAGADCVAELDMPPRHRDPFDEMLLVHAQQLGARLLTRDRALLGHPLAVPL